MESSGVFQILYFIYCLICIGITYVAQAYIKRYISEKKTRIKTEFIHFSVMFLKCKFNLSDNFTNEFGKYAFNYYTLDELIKRNEISYYWRDATLQT